MLRTFNVLVHTLKSVWICLSYSACSGWYAKMNSLNKTGKVNKHADSEGKVYIYMSAFVLW
jgi:hypothetical protein